MKATQKDGENVVAAHSYLKSSVPGGIKGNSGFSLLLTSNYGSEDPQLLLCKPQVPSAAAGKGM